MSSPALRRRQKILASLAGTLLPPAAAPAAPAGDTQAGQEYAALKAVLHDQLRNLSDIQSHELRQPKKAEYAAIYRPWIEGLLEANLPVQDEILVTNMIWAIDYHDFAYALRLARFAIGHGLILPERYNRTMACFVGEEIATLALASHEDVPHEVLLEVAQLVEGADMPDPALAKLKKALGRSWLRRADSFDPAADNAPAGGALAYAEQALTDLQRALALDANAGVKKDIQRAEALMKKLAAPAST